MYYQLIYLWILSSICDYTIGSGTWDYGKHGPDVWKDIDPNCAGQRQSPINIQTACTKHQQFEPLSLTSAHGDSLNFTLINNGHTITGQTSDTRLFLTGGNLNGNYTFRSFHLHWGPNYNTGSEHQVNGDKFAGECHFVYKHNEFEQFAVLAFFMESRNLTQDKSYLMKPIHDVKIETEWIKYFDEAKNLIKENDSTTINLILSSLMGSNLNNFWRYTGSLTTPPCTENVNWTIFRQPILILNYEFESFRDDLFFESYRGPQPLYKRPVLRSFPDEIPSSIPEQSCCLKPQSNIAKRLTNSDISFLSIFYFALFYFVMHYLLHLK